MGQKVNPHGLRVGVIKDWDSRWYARNEKVGDLVVEDYKLRKYLKKTLYSAGIPKIEIERDNAKIKIYLHCARPGVVIGKGGTEIERLRLELEKKLGKPVALMNKDDKVKAIQFLNQNGAFLVTKSGDKVAKYFGISKYTLYSYIDSKQQEGKTT